MQKRGGCIFCGGTPLSAEHVWPKWISRVMPSMSVVSCHSSAEAVRVHSRLPYHFSPVTKGKQTRPGPLTSRKLRVVCKKCNNGWMSALQQAARPLLLKLMTNREWTAVDNSDETTLLKWMTMFGIVAEHLNPTRVTTSEIERNLFFKSESPLSNWAAWIGFYDNDALGAADARHGQIQHSALGKLCLSGEEWQIGVSTAICGGLLFQTVNTRLEQTRLDVQSWATTNGLVFLRPNSSFRPRKIKVFGVPECDELHGRLGAVCAASK